MPTGQGYIPPIVVPKSRLVSQSSFSYRKVVVVKTDFQRAKFQKLPPVCGPPILKEGIGKKLADKSMVFGLVFTNQQTTDNHVIPKATAVLKQLYSTCFPKIVGQFEGVQGFATCPFLHCRTLWRTSHLFHQSRLPAT